MSRLMKWFRKLLLPALNRPSTATLISSCSADARALARRPESAEISYRAAKSAARSRAGGLSECDSIQAAPLLDDEHVAGHSARKVVGCATPNMLIDPGMSGEADYQQIDGILLDEIANHPDGMPGRNHGLDVHGVRSRTHSTVLGKLPEVAIGAILLFAQLVDHFGVAGDLLLDANHAEMRAQAGRQLDRRIEGLTRVVGTVVCN